MPVLTTRKMKPFKSFAKIEPAPLAVGFGIGLAGEYTIKDYRKVQPFLGAGLIAASGFLKTRNAEVMNVGAGILLHWSLKQAL